MSSYEQAYLYLLERSFANPNRINGANFGFLHKNGKKSWLGDGVCHGKLNISYDKKKTAQYIISLSNNRLHKAKRKDIPLIKRYIKWLFKESPYKDCFLNKTLQSAQEHGFILDASKPANLLVGACMASRQTKDAMGSKAVYPYWRTLLKYNFDPTLAFLVAPMVGEKQKGLYTIAHNNVILHGWPISTPNCTIKYINSFLNNDRKRLNDPYNEIRGYRYTNPYGIAEIWGNYRTNSEHFRDKVERKLKDVLDTEEVVTFTGTRQVICCDNKDKFFKELKKAVDETLNL